MFKGDSADKGTEKFPILLMGDEQDTSNVQGPASTQAEISQCILKLGQFPQMSRIRANVPKSGKVKTKPNKTRPNQPKPNCQTVKPHNTNPKSKGSY